MSGPQQHASKLKVEIDGQPLAADFDSALVSAFVENSAGLPDVFQLTIRDQHRTVLERTKARIGSTVKLSMLSESETSGELLINGEITALQAEFDPDGMMTVLRGYDHSHRLFRGRVTEAYTDVTYSDVARRVATRAGLTIGTIEASSTVHRHVTQANVTDWQFLKGLANEIGYDVGCFDGKFDFRKPRRSHDAPSGGTLSSEEPMQLTLGTTLLRFRSIISAAEQVSGVRVRGWDVANKKALVGTASARTNSAAVGVEPAALAKTFKSPDYVGVDRPYGTQSEVDAAAAAVAEQIAGAFAEFEGVARGNTKLRAGKAVSLGLVKAPFDGKYTLTSTRHSYDSSHGYTVWFTVSGRQDRSLLGLASGGGGGASLSAGPPIYGVVPALVSDTNDPEHACRVRLKFPWLSDTYSSDWCRTVQLSAGGNRGGAFVSEVNDEVLVAFEQGDVRRPYVIGGLHNGVDKPDLGSGLVEGGTGAIQQRSFVSRKGHRLAFGDGATSGITLRTGDANLEIILDASQTKITVKSSGDVEISGLNVKVEASAQMTLKAGAGITIDGGPTVKVTGGVVQLN